MSRLAEDIIAFLSGNGFEGHVQNRSGLDIIHARSRISSAERMILPLEISAQTIGQARQQSMKAAEIIQMIEKESGYPIIITEDRWNRQRGVMEKRLLAHMEVFSQAYARNCEVRRIDKETAGKFLEDNHSYGDAACKYRYGLYLKRHTGHIARRLGMDCSENIGQLIAVATFSNARKWIKEGKEIRSYEWVRYASLPDLRVSGGMGRLLKTFINEVQPDDIMSYADLEWSEGRVYKALGFMEDAAKDPVGFEISPQDWKRTALKGLPDVQGMAGQGTTTVADPTGKLYFVNFGSRKLRLKLTDYR